MSLKSDKLTKRITEIQYFLNTRNNQDPNIWTSKHRISKYS